MRVDELSRAGRDEGGVDDCLSILRVLPETQDWSNCRTWSRTVRMINALGQGLTSSVKNPGCVEQPGGEPQRIGLC